MTQTFPKIQKRWFVLIAALAAAGLGWANRERLTPLVQNQVTSLKNRLKPTGPETAAAGQKEEHDHGGHDHAGHDESSSIELSEQARKNIGLKTGKVQLGTFTRTIPIPGIVVERRGWTKSQIVAPLTGIVTKVYVIEGEALRPGQPLFDLRLTHEDLVQAQVEFLKIAEDLDVVNKEIERLRPATEKGSIPQKSLLDRVYEQQKLTGAQRAQRESLLLHGLSSQQVGEILETRTLRSNLTVYVPEVLSGGNTSQPTSKPAAHAREGLFSVEELKVETGRLVSAGDQLLSLADYSELYVEGNAFEQDGQLVADALREGWKITAIVENHTPSGTKVPDLSILRLSDEIDSATRTLHFYLRLSNEKTRDAVVDGHRFINWRFKPGQRTQLLVPVEEWPKRIVLPADAVVQEGAESYVFQQNGNHFDRRSVHVEYSDLVSVVIAQDGSLFPGDTVALTGAQQMQMALKNKAGGAPDPHAGHNH